MSDPTPDAPETSPQPASEATEASTNSTAQTVKTEEPRIPSRYPPIIEELCASVKALAESLLARVGPNPPHPGEYTLDMFRERFPDVMQ